MTNQEKEQFFALYWKQDVGMRSFGKETRYVDRNFLQGIYTDESYLLLKDLKKISDEDAIDGYGYGVGFLRICNTKLNYMTVKELLIKFQEYQLEFKVLNANCAHNAAANLFMERYGVKNCSIPDVVLNEAESEVEFYCDGQENNKDRCESQCLGCAGMQEIYSQ